MKKTMTFLIAFLLILAACNSSSTKNEPMKSDKPSQTFNLDTNALKSGQSYYQCPMDLEVISDKAGPCPKCGMDLEKRIKQ